MAPRGRHPDLTIVQLDAHPDLYDEFEGDRFSHACPFARIMEGGLSVREVLGVLQALPGPLVGADVVEFNPAADVDGLTAPVAAKLVKELASRMLETEVPGT